MKYEIIFNVVAFVCGRIGGDEFVVVGRGEGFAKVFEYRFNAELERKNKNLNKPYLLDASIMLEQLNMIYMYKKIKASPSGDALFCYLTLTFLFPAFLNNFL